MHLAQETLSNEAGILNYFINEESEFQGSRLTNVIHKSFSCSNRFVLKTAAVMRDAMRTDQKE